MEKICKLMQLDRIKSFESEKDEISKYVSDMDYFQDGEIVPFTALLANNIRDRQLDRFPHNALSIFQKTIVGKMRLLNHDSKERTGRFYGASLIKKSIDEVMAMFDTVHFPGLSEHLAEIEKIDGGLYFLKTKFYMLNKTPRQQENVSNVIGGIDAFMSISFTGFKMVPIYEETDGEQNLKYYEYRLRDGFPAEALEGSAVFLGAQYAAQTISSKSFATIDIQNKWIELEEIEDKQIREICQELDSLIVKGITHAEMNGDEFSFVEEEKAKWTTAYINSLEDDCFAAIEPGGKKDDEGKTVPRNYRHGPHHKKGQGAPGTGGTVDLPHLRNLLARADQIKPASGKISQSELIKKVRNHAIAHAKKLGVGDYKEHKETVTMDEFILSIPSLNLAKSVKPEEKEWQSEIENEVKKKMQAFEGDRKFASEIKKIFGEIEIGQIEQIKKDAEAYKTSEIERALKFGTLSNMIQDSEKEAKKKWFESLPVSQVTEWADHYQKDYKAKNPGTPQVDGDNNNASTQKEATSEDFKRSQLSGYQAS